MWMAWFGPSDDCPIAPCACVYRRLPRRSNYRSQGCSPRKRGLAGTRFQAKTLELLEIVKQVLVEYEEYLPLTLRQIFYRLVGAHGFEKSERAYANLGGHLASARRAGIIPWDHIRDDGLTDLTPRSWEDMGDLLEACVNTARDFRLDRQYNQPRRLFFCIEASGMAPQIGRIADRYGVRVLSSGGFDSLTVKHDLAAELYSHAATEVLHLGDHDASGVHVYSSLKEDVTQMMQDMAEEEDVRWDPDFGHSALGRGLLQLLLRRVDYDISQSNNCRLVSVRRGRPQRGVRREAGVRARTHC
jgi:hypothetical protein